MGLFHEFVDDEDVRMIGVEAGKLRLLGALAGLALGEAVHRAAQGWHGGSENRAENWVCRGRHDWREQQHVGVLARCAVWLA